jgi:hypothetical protein
MTFISIVFTFFTAYWLDILVGGVVLMALTLLWKKGKQKAVIRIIKALVAKAEQQYGSKTGLIKLEAVWSEIYVHIPWIIRIFFTEKELAGYIEASVKWLANLLLDYPKINLLTYAEEKLKGEDTDE